MSAEGRSATDGAAIQVVLSGDMKEVMRAESVLGTLRYDGGAPEDFYSRMSRDLMARHGRLIQVDYASHFPEFEIWFRYEDGTRVYSGRRTGHYDIHFLSLGYVGEGPRYARHFLAAAGYGLESEDIESIEPGDSIVMEEDGAIIRRSEERVVAHDDVTFLRERNEVVAGFPAVYRHYSAKSKADALAFLEDQEIAAQSFFVVVETPDGNLAKDRMGIYEP
jgi:hypothetical protein